MGHTLMLTLLGAVLFCIAFAYSSFAEWHLHRYVMHTRIAWFEYPYEAHAITHHQLFQADKTYHCTDENVQHKIHMAWWNGPVIILIGMIPAYVLAAPFFYFGFFEVGWVIIVSCISAGIAYFTLYETLHWFMHLPKARWIERLKVFRWINGHHVLHHRYVDKNLNVVMPLADWWFGTLITRSPRPFMQVRGPSVPDVQPISA